jgi:hypothetical protein
MILALIPISCAKNVNVEDLSHKDKAAWAMQLYIGSAQDFQRDVQRPDLSDEMKKYLAQKRDVLVRAHPIIKLYKQYADTDQIPSIELQREMLNIVDELLLYPALDRMVKESD